MSAPARSLESAACRWRPHVGGPRECRLPRPEHRPRSRPGRTGWRARRGRGAATGAARSGRGARSPCAAGSRPGGNPRSQDAVVRRHGSAREQPPAVHPGGRAGQPDALLQRRPGAAGHRLRRAAGVREDARRPRQPGGGRAEARDHAHGARSSAAGPARGPRGNRHRRVHGHRGAQPGRRLLTPHACRRPPCRGRRQGRAADREPRRPVRPRGARPAIERLLRGPGEAERAPSPGPALAGDDRGRRRGPRGRGHPPDGRRRHRPHHDHQHPVRVLLAAGVRPAARLRRARGPPRRHHRLGRPARSQAAARRDQHVRRLAQGRHRLRQPADQALPGQRRPPAQPGRGRRPAPVPRHRGHLPEVQPAVPVRLAGHRGSGLSGVAHRPDAPGPGRSDRGHADHAGDRRRRGVPGRHGRRRQRARGREVPPVRRRPLLRGRAGGPREQGAVRLRLVQGRPGTRPAPARQDTGPRALPQRVVQQRGAGRRAGHRARDGRLRLEHLQVPDRLQDDRRAPGAARPARRLPPTP